MRQISKRLLMKFIRDKLDFKLIINVIVTGIYLILFIICAYIIICKTWDLGCIFKYPDKLSCYLIPISLIGFVVSGIITIKNEEYTNLTVAYVYGFFITLILIILGLVIFGLIPFIFIDVIPFILDEIVPFITDNVLDFFMNFIKSFELK